jgi:hypothetical protein
MRVVRGNGPLQGPSGSGEWVTGHKRDVVRRTGKEIYGEKLDGITTDQRGDKEMVGAGWCPEKDSVVA